MSPSQQNRPQQELRAAFKRLERLLPTRVGSTLRWLRHPASLWARLPVGLLLIVGGIFSFLPVLGVWMLPLGLMLIAADVPILRRPMARLTMWIIDRIERWQAKRPS
ncbi:hypothetical protein [Bosea sp. (in: a-proteobacteria)]|jgi:hypothetical protein|uniref:hypothetical protein n=1 Tax=Bosea sp. (in: a-proteobacteria) TaxID=1871050 RepID=UPI0027334ED8|nr:hypothetical protein [Bosea sp. (in: a-proteobacteria)]MDP3411376.1 hypothetical protein [Bosea sp. (in: a-proteobacteria)]